MFKFEHLKTFITQRNEPITLMHLFSFLHKLEMLLTANIPVIQCIEMLEKSEESIAVKKLIFYAKKDLYAGKKISESFAYFSGYVEPFFYQLLHIGEETGKLLICIKQLVEYLKNKIEFRKQLKQALFYPTIIILIALLIFFSLVIFVVPEFANLFKESNLVLPIYTRILFSLSHFIRNFIYYLVTMLILAIFFVMRLKMLNVFKIKLLIILRQIGFIRAYQEKYQLIQFCQQLATCLSAGLVLIEALRLINQNELNHSSLNVNDIIEQIKKGLSLNVALEALHFPVFVVEMVKIGEAAGMLEKVLFYLSSYYQDEMNIFLIKVKTMIEPLIICVLGVLIGFLVLGIYLPIFNLGSLAA